MFTTIPCLYHNKNPREDVPGASLLDDTLEGKECVVVADVVLGIVRF